MTSVFGGHGTEDGRIALVLGRGWRGLAALLCLPLLTLLATGAAAQTVWFAAGTYRVTEGDALRPELVLSHPRSEGVTVMVETLDLGEAESGEDFAAGPWSVTVPAGNTRHRFDIETFVDDKIESDEEVLLHISPYGHSPGVQRSRGGTPDAVVVIRESSTRISLPKSHYTVSEGGTVTIGVAMENPRPTNFTLDYTLSGDTASGADVVGGFGTRSITVPANERSVDIPVETVRDGVRGEDTETFSVRLSTSEPRILFGRRSASVSIIDNDARVSFRKSYYTVSEGGTATIGIAIENPQSTAITLDYTLSGSTASGADVVGGFGTRSVIVPANERGVNISVETVQDEIQGEGSWGGAETFSVRLSTSESGVVFGRRIADVSINDDDGPAPRVTFASQPGGVVGEESGTHNVQLQLSPAPNSDITLHFSTLGNARRGSDYTMPGSVTVRASSTTATIPVTIIDDSRTEYLEDLELRLERGGGYRVGNSQFHSYIIYDNDPAISFASASQSASEKSGTRDVTVNLSSASASDITLGYEVSGTATSGSDYEALSGTVTVSAGDTTATIPVAIVDDSAEEYLESIVLSLSDSGYYTPPPYRHTLIIADDDRTPPPSKTVVSFASASSQANEGSTRNVAVNLWPAPTSDITLGYTVGGTATSGSDYEALSGTVTVSAGDTTATIPVVIVDDSAEEDSETVVLTLTAGTDYTLGSRSTHRLTVGANDRVRTLVSFVLPFQFAREWQGSRDVTVSLWPPSASALTLHYTVSGTATPNADYVALPGTVTVPAGVTSVVIPVEIIDDSIEDSGEKVVLTLDRGTGYRLVGPRGGGGWKPRHTLYIFNHDSNDLEGLVRAQIDEAAANGDVASGNLWRRALAAVRGEAPPSGLAPLTEAEAQAQADAETAGGNTALAALWTDIAHIVGAATPPTPAVPEVAIAAGADATEGGDATFTVTATPAPTSSLTVDVTVTEAGGYATAGTHQVTIPPGGSATLTVATAGDDTDAPDGTVTATLAAGTDYTVSATSGSATVAVTDDDATAVTLSVPDPVATEGDADDTASIALTLNRGLVGAESLAVPLQLAGGAVGTDFTLSAPRPLPAGVTFAGSTVTFAGPASGQSAASVTLTLGALVDADTAERTVTVSIPSSSTGSAPTLTAAGLGGGASGARTGDGRMTLSDAPPVVTPEVSISGGGGVTEGGDARFTVTAAPAPDEPLAVSVTVSTDGAFGITHGSRTVTLPTAGSAVLTLATTDDTTDEPNGSVTATLAAGAGYTVSATAGAATVAVADDDAPPATPTGVDPALIAEVQGHIAHFTARSHGAGIRDWGLILDRLEGRTGGMSDAAIAAWLARSRLHGWQDGIVTLPKVQAALAALEAVPEPVTEPEPATLPAVTVAAGASPVTEGGDATFTLTANPTPTADLAVSVTVAAAGDYGIAGESRTVTLPPTGSVTLTLATTDDTTDEPDGAVTVTLNDGDGYTVGAPASGTVTIEDDDLPPPEVSIAADAASITEGAPAAFTLSADRAPDADLTITLAVSEAADGDHVAADDEGAQTVTIAKGATEAVFSVATVNDTTDEPDGAVTVTVTDGDGYTVGAPASGTVSIEDDDLPPPEVSIAADAASITEGAPAAFTLSADRAPDADLTITLAVSEAVDGDHVAADDEGAQTVTIAKGATQAAFSVATVNDTTDEPDGAVTVTLNDGAGYTVSSSRGAATVSVSDNDTAAGPVLSVADATVTEGDWAEMMPFAVRLSAAAAKRVRVRASTRVSSPVSARPKEDYWPLRSELVTFYPGETEKTVWVYIYNDSHDEAPETFEVVLSEAEGAPIGDGVAVGTIVNDDPMPAAWLGRFGRTVAEQALDGISGRMAASRTPGMQGTLAGQALTFGAPAHDDAAPGPATVGAPAFGGTGALALADIARGFDGHGAVGDTGRFGDAGFGHGPESGPGQAFGGTQSHTMTAREALLGSSFTLTGATDATGGSMAFWGRGSQARFDGREGTFSLDGEVTTGMLGADYARGRWLIGLALTQSTGEGEYRDTEAAPRPASQTCLDGMDAATRALCNGAVRAGDGEVEASLTAAIPYASLQASERLKLWGAAGYGSGEVTLKTAMDGSYSSDTTWRMAAAGLRGDLLAPPESGSGPALALTSDALWARTASEKTRDLAASQSDATRLRLGLEGSYRFTLEGGGTPGTGSGASLTPKLEVGARHDGGDAETGFGIELGGGLAWVDPALGLSLDLSGRTLLSHDDDALENRGYAASLGFDPDPATERGPSFALRQEFGARADGGLDALFAPDPLDERPGGELTSRWTAEAAYGFPAFGGRFTASPHVGLGLSATARDYNLGWRWTPAPSAPDLSFGLGAARRESGTAAPEHRIGFEVRARW